MLDDLLPPRLADRTTPLSDAAPRADGAFMVYWMRAAVRGHDNPALDAAMQAARALELPVFVYHAVSERYPYASDRHHTFILEGARDVSRELRGRGVGYAFHLERPGHRGPWLKQLADRAALVVTEDMPIDFLDRWTDALAASTHTPIWRVDAACLASIKQLGRAYGRAFEFRRAASPLHDAALADTPFDAEPPGPPFVPELPFEPIDFETADIAELVAACEIDHGVGPVPHTPGGSVAGYARWEAFCGRPLDVYDRTRNDPLRFGVSRMSAYLHYGHVSPWRLARDCAKRGSRGADKYLDELLVWRELAWSFCRYRPEHGTTKALPGWARETLRQHESDPRRAIYSWGDLAHSRTDSPLWNAAQASLRVNGELHNNVRMTWGKEVLQWTPNAERALELLIDLNHRYALDGRDPASYGGILWCLGGLDRPFRPETPVFGAVRERTAAYHEQRLDVARWSTFTNAPAHPDPRRVAVIGAGMAGAAAAHSLAAHGWDVVAFDKGRGPGGRMSTRRDGPQRYDHGAQYFTARDRDFRRYVASWVQAGHVAEWRGAIGTLERGVVTPKPDGPARYVGVPGMNAVVRHLCDGLDVRFGQRVTRLERGPRGWAIEIDGGDVERFDAVIVTVPAPQAATLLADVAPAVAAACEAREVAPCMAAMVHFADRVPLDLDGAFVQASPLSWAARNTGRPGRPDGERWVLHAGPDWSREHVDDDPQQAAEALVDAFAAALATSLPAPITVGGHRWRYALPVCDGVPERCVFDAGRELVVAGDAWAGGRVEGAWLSGRAAAARLLSLPVRDDAPTVDRATGQVQLL